MVNAAELLWAVLALQLAALGGIGGLLWRQAETAERVRQLDGRVSKLERNFG